MRADISEHRYLAIRPLSLRLAAPSLHHLIYSPRHAGTRVRTIGNGARFRRSRGSGTALPTRELGGRTSRDRALALALLSAPQPQRSVRRSPLHRRRVIRRRVLRSLACEWADDLPRGARSRSDRIQLLRAKVHVAPNAFGRAAHVLTYIKPRSQWRCRSNHPCQLPAANLRWRCFRGPTALGATCGGDSAKPHPLAVIPTGDRSRSPFRRPFRCASISGSAAESIRLTAASR